MPKAEINTASGTKIVIEGTVEEIKAIVNTFGRDISSSSNPCPKARINKNSKTASGPTARVLKLKNKDFFASPKTISEVKTALATEGHIYAVTSLSGPLLEFTRNGLLRRIKDEKGNWTYVNP
ncbi:MAG: hypothetical protein WC483_04675 [Candidatus Paceibacterota bacterium]